jgi:hypothetical protein
MVCSAIEQWLKAALYAMVLENRRDVSNASQQATGDTKKAGAAESRGDQDRCPPVSGTHRPDPGSQDSPAKLRRAA